MPSAHRLATTQPHAWGLHLSQNEAPKTNVDIPFGVDQISQKDIHSSIDRLHSPSFGDVHTAPHKAWKGTEQTASQTTQRNSCKARNDQKWDTYKDEIWCIYMNEGRTLPATREIIAKHGFTASERKWKSKLKEWGFNRYILARDMGIMVAKAEKRKRDEGKDTVFLHGETVVQQEKLEAFKKRRKLSLDVMSPIPETPPNITYSTPGPQTPGPEIDHADEPSHIEGNSGQVSESHDFSTPGQTTLDRGISPIHEPQHTGVTLTDSNQGERHEDIISSQINSTGIRESTPTSQANKAHQVIPFAQTISSNFHFTRVHIADLGQFWMVPEDVGLRSPYEFSYNFSWGQLRAKNSAQYMEGICQYSMTTDCDVKILETYVHGFLSGSGGVFFGFADDRDSATSAGTLIPQYRELVSISEKHFGASGRATILCVWRLAYLLARSGERGAAELHFERAVEEFKKLGWSQQGSECHIALGRLFCKLRLWDDAIRHLTSALESACSSGWHCFGVARPFSEILKVLKVAIEGYNSDNFDRSDNRDETLDVALVKVASLQEKVALGVKNKESFNEVWVKIAALADAFSTFAKYGIAERLFKAVMPRIETLSDIDFGTRKVAGYTLYCVHLYRGDEWLECVEYICKSYESILTAATSSRYQNGGRVARPGDYPMSTLKWVFAEVVKQPEVLERTLASKVQQATELGSKCGAVFEALENL